MFFSNPSYFLHMVQLGYVPDAFVQENATQFLPKINNFLTYIYKEKYIPSDYAVTLHSGWRSSQYNATLPRAAHFSNHIIGHAIDIGPDNHIILMLEKNTHLLEMFGLHAESSLDTSIDGGWTHLQDLKPKSGALIFRA